MRVTTLTGTGIPFQRVQTFYPYLNDAIADGLHIGSNINVRAVRGQQGLSYRAEHLLVAGLTNQMAPVLVYVSPRHIRSFTRGDK